MLTFLIYLLYTVTVIMALRQVVLFMALGGAMNRFGGAHILPSWWIHLWVTTALVVASIWTVVA